MSKQVRGYVWWCGDDVCDCTQPTIDYVEPNPRDWRFMKTEEIWRGTFRTDSEPGGYAELMKVRKSMKRAGWDVDRIEWQPTSDGTMGVPRAS